MSNADQAKLIARTWEEMDPFDKAEMGWEDLAEAIRIGMEDAVRRAKDGACE
jgi:hypothetical protein